MDSARPYRITLPPEGALERMVLGAPVAVPPVLWAKLVALSGQGEPVEGVLLFDKRGGRWLVRRA